MADLSLVRSALGNAWKSLDYSEDAEKYREQQEGIRAGRLGMAIKELEEGERIKRDTQALLTRARIELRKRMVNRALASRSVSGGMFG